jgi:hypothetical protein
MAKLNNLSKENKYHKCPVCGLEYKERIWVKKCEKWCKKHKSCNLEVIKHSLKN